HRLRRLFQLLELRGLVRDPSRDFLQISRDVGYLDPQGADTSSKLRYQACAVDLNVAAHDAPRVAQQSGSHGPTRQRVFMRKVAAPRRKCSTDGTLNRPSRAMSLSAKPAVRRRSTAPPRSILPNVDPFIVAPGSCGSVRSLFREVIRVREAIRAWLAPAGWIRGRLARLAPVDSVHRDREPEPCWKAHGATPAAG